jgi:hypothetical protein
MYHFDSNGDSIALYKFSPMVTTVGSKMEYCPDGGYIIAGTTYEYDNTPHGFIIKLDSLCRFTPQGHITASGPVEFCFGDSLNLYGPVGNYTYYWSTGENTPSIVVYTTGSYYLTIIGTSGNSATLNPVNVFASNPGTPQITNHIDYLEVSAVGSYQWYRNGVPIPGATHDTLQTTLTGNFNVVVTDTVGCIRIAPLFYYSWTGVEEEKNSANLVYPVPASTEIYLQGIFRNSTINILDVRSKIISRIENLSGENVRIDINDLPQGVYFLQYDGGDFRKFVVMR